MHNVIVVVTVLMSFFMRFFDFELLSTFYFTAVNSDLELRRSVAGKKRNVA